MKQFNKENLLALGIIGLLVLMAFAFKDDSTKIYLIGDSTMSIKEKSAFPETGWGVPFAGFFKESAEVINKAKNGRSTRTFIEEGLWESVLTNLKKGDYVLIQFGHNDESESKKDRYTTPVEFSSNLQKFVEESSAKGAKPILISPVSRRKFVNGQAQETHPLYTKLVAQLAEEQQLSYIDLDTLSRRLYQSYGEDKSRLLFLWLNEGEHPNYPNGIEDNTHFNELGARLIAQLVLKEIKRQQIDLQEYIIEAVLP